MELLDKGKHCEEEYCHQLDLLPMKCKACNHFYCSEHFKYESHNCKEHKKFDFKIPTCELCNKTIEFRRGDDMDMCLARHMEKCQFNEIAPKKVNSEKCAHKTCKTKTNGVFKFECLVCHKNFCNKHRIPEDHECTGIMAKSCSQEARKQKGSIFNDLALKFNLLKSK
ncbi:unnamed protein product [Brachionus calyciflorus]|uniref:AN1-type domain-containing protein n=1 Tax=Brachionus calyciflorus TaxID=104777 RepID=A0A813X4X1_9BILA|nr:unnamed protein product [Brachionus calyciflorus]